MPKFYVGTVLPDKVYDTPEAAIEQAKLESQGAPGVIFLVSEEEFTVITPLPGAEVTPVE